MKQIFKVMIAAAVAVFMAASCASQPELSGKWSVDSIGEMAVAGQQINGLENVPFLEFNAQEGRVHGNAGVNVVNSTYALDGESLKFGDAATTMMAGTEEAMQVEQAFLGAFAKVATFNVAEDVLKLSDAEGNVVMTLKKVK